MTSRQTEQERAAFTGAVQLSQLAGGLPHFRLGGIRFVDVRGMFPDDRTGHRTSMSPKRVVVFHHDGIAYNGATFGQDLSRLETIYRFHIDKGWGGSGYHFAISPTAAHVYILGGLDESRAHTSGAARSANPGLWGNDLPNAVAIGVVWLGDFTGDARPTPAALALYQELVRWLPTVLDRNLVAVPHKGAHPKHTVCPGDWIHETAIDTFTPAGALQPDPAPREALLLKLMEAQDTIDAAFAAAIEFIEGTDQ